MEVIWKSSEKESPILYRNRLRRPGFAIYHWRVLPGKLPEETRAAHEINIAISGAVVTQNHTSSGNSHKITHQAGSMCLIPVGHSAKAAWETEIECMRIALDPAFVRQAAMEHNLSNGELEMIETYNRRDPVIQCLSLALLNEVKTKEIIGLVYAESLAETLILHLLKNYSTGGRSRQSLGGGLSGYRLRRAQEFINENLEEDLTLRQIAEAAGLSLFHFAREFRRSTGFTPQQYLTRQRVARAKQLLADGDLPLAEVVLRAGFKNQSHFTTLFRKFTALTPLAFRQLKHR